MKPTRKKALWLLLWILPALWTGSLVFRYGVDVPHFDQWNGLCPMFAKADAGTLGFADFFAQHNEHRILFPRIIMYSLARLTNWNVRAELFVIWLLGCICAASLVRTAAVTGFKPFENPWLIFAMIALVFSPLGWENWLWGFQIGFWLPVACIAAITWIASSVRFPFNFVATTMLCVVCTYSIGGGFAYWLIVFPLLLFSEGRARWTGRKKWILGYILCFIISTGVYFIGYQKPEHIPSPFLALQHPIQSVMFALAVLGSPFAHGTALHPFPVAQIVGSILIVLLLSVLVMIWRFREDSVLLARVCPWLTFAGFACVNAVAITGARMGMGLVESALPSRYTPFSMALPVGLLFLVPIVLNRWRTDSDSKPRVDQIRTGLTGLTTAFVLLHVAGSVAILDQWRETKHSRLTEKSIVLCANIVDDPQAMARYVHPNPEPLKPLVSFLDRLSYLRPGLLNSDAISEIAQVPVLEPDYFGGIEQSYRPADDRCLIRGWAVLPNKERAADVVLLTCDDLGGSPRIFAIATVDLPRLDLETSMKSTPYRYSGWVKDFRLSALPHRSGRLRAWAFDAEDKRAFPMKGAVDISS